MIIENNDRIIDMTRALGRAIQQDERYQAFAAAREENDADAALQDAIGRFNLTRMNLNAELARDPRDEAQMAARNDEMRRAYEEVMGSEGMARYQKTKTELDALHAHINVILAAAINGGDPDTVQPPSSCGGDCGGCNGCG